MIGVVSDLEELETKAGVRLYEGGIITVSLETTQWDPLQEEPILINQVVKEINGAYDTLKSIKNPKIIS